MRINWKALDEPKMGDAIGVIIVLLATVIVALIASGAKADGQHEKGPGDLERITIEADTVSNPTVNTTIGAEIKPSNTGVFENSGNLRNSTDYTNIGLAMQGPMPAQVTGCYVPKKKMGRGWRFLFGAVEVSATVELDPDCVAAQQETLRLQIELEKAKADRARAECDFERCVGK